MATETRTNRPFRQVYIALPVSAFDALTIAAVREDRGVREQARRYVIEALTTGGYLPCEAEADPPPFRAVARGSLR